ncbi:MAG TPA: alanine racemase [Clostridia bacterium]
MLKAVINLKNIKHNFEIIKSQTKSKICAIIKADAYGHGLVQVAQALKSADCFGVARPCEAFELRDAGITNDILILGGFEISELDDLIKRNVIISVHSKEELKHLKKAAKGYDGNVRIHIKVDSGMNRLGVQDKQELISILNSISILKNIKCEAVYTHYSTSDSDTDYLQEQYNKFCYITDSINLKKHSANSAAIFCDDKYHMDMVRPGIMLYGYIGNKNLITKDGKTLSKILKPAMRITSNIIQIKSIESGSFIGYDKGYNADKKLKAAIISCGYGDGYPRLINNGYVIINNKKCKILGKVCMDSAIVDITDAGKVNLKDEVIILGEKLGADIIAEWNNTISYDILCAVTKRVKKEWLI